MFSETMGSDNPQNLLVQRHELISELLQTAKISIMVLMSRDDTGEIRDDLAEYKKQFDSLREDFGLLVRHSPLAWNDILATSNQRDNPGFNQAEVERCRKFVEKYGIRVG
jgi:hypothetical protein